MYMSAQFKHEIIKKIKERLLQINLNDKMQNTFINQIRNMLSVVIL